MKDKINQYLEEKKECKIRDLEKIVKNLQKWLNL